MPTEKSERFAEMCRMFARFGFIETPLNASELSQLISWGWDDDAIYSIGCDCASGYRFREALEYYTAAGEAVA